MLNTHQEACLYNKVTIRGVLEEKPRYDHSVKSKQGSIFYYGAVVKTPRKNGVFDSVPIVFEKKLKPNGLSVNDLIEVQGRIQTFNTDDKRLKVFIRATAIKVYKDEQEMKADGGYENSVCVEGHICSKEDIRTTSRTARRIATFKIRIKRPSGQNSYVPCLAWGEYASLVEKLNKGTCVGLTARFQSRDYQKPGIPELKRTFELSVKKIFVI